MRSTLWASTCLISMFAVPAFAETSITTATSTPITTTNDSIKITSTGSIKPTSGTALTIATNHGVINEGTIETINASGSRGIVANADVASSITNAASGKILLTETYTPVDTDKDGNLDGDYAEGSDRIGIQTLGAFTGNITNSGTITIEGNSSAGILLGGTLTGKFVSDGTVSVLGNNAVGIGLDNVVGDVRLAGTIAATGSNAVAARIGGDVTGALEVQGSLTSTGYRYTTAPANPASLDPDDLLAGGPALSIEGSVTKGIILAIPPKESNAGSTDDDNDGIEDSKEGSASVRSFGEAPAMRIGSSTEAITIGAVAGSEAGGYGLVNNGTIAGSGVYAGKNANGLQIGGTGQTVGIAKGMLTTGTIGALSLDAAATAIRIGEAATVPTIENRGKIEAISNGTAAGSTATAILIETGASVTEIRNSGNISAKTGGEAGSASAIVDRSGTVASVTNSGQISATGAAADSGRNIAIDLSARTGDTTISQTLVGASFAAPNIIGDVKFGAGNDLFDILDGNVTGNTSFGAGNNRLNLSGDALYTGNSSFGGGDDNVTIGGTARYIGNLNFGGGTDALSISETGLFSGKLEGAAGLAASVSGGILDVKGNANIASLAVTNAGTLAVTLGGADDTNIIVSGDANFGANSKLLLQLSSIEEGEGSHVVLTAGSITGADNLTTSTDFLPFLYTGTLTKNDTTLTVEVARKDTDDLGLNRSEAAAFNAIIDAAGNDEFVENSILGIRDGDSFRAKLQQMLPEHEGGVFDMVTSASRTLARVLQDPKAPYKDEGKWGYYISQVVWGSSKDIDDTAGYDVSGWGISLGGEIRTNLGDFGASVAYLGGKNGNAANANEVTANQWEGALHWRLASNGFQAQARVSGAPISLSGSRFFDGAANGIASEKTVRGKWDAKLYSASGSVAYDMSAGGIILRPSVGVDYYKLSEDGYTETGGGDGLNLTVLDRNSDEMAVNGSMTVGLNFGARDEYDGWTRFELEAGRRQIVGGELGQTTASFKDGTPFILTPNERTSGWVGRLRGLAGNNAFQVGGEMSAEEQQGKMAWAFRASLRLGL